MATTNVIGILSVTSPGAWGAFVRQELGLHYPGRFLASYESDKQCVYTLEVSYPSSNARYALAYLHQATGYEVTWSWQAPEGVTVFPGGTLSVYCPDRYGERAGAWLGKLFPYDQIYVFIVDGGNCYHIDTPEPDTSLWLALREFVGMLSGSAWSWYSWSGKA